MGARGYPEGYGQSFLTETAASRPDVPMGNDNFAQLYCEAMPVAKKLSLYVKHTSSIENMNYNSYIDLNIHLKYMSNIIFVP